jgi:hypothetical protein
MSYMKIQRKSSFFIVILLILPIFASFTILEINAAENTSVTAKGFENTVVIEFENGGMNALDIKTIRMWVSTDNSFKSFKSELGWSGTKYSDGQLLEFTASDMLKPGESVKFGVITDKKVSGINWKAITNNGNEIGPEKVEVVEISQTQIIVENENVENVKQTGETLYGTKTFIPDNLRIGSNVRLVGDGFSPEQIHQLYLNDEFLKSAKSDGQGNFITTINIPNNVNAGLNEFKIINELGSSQISNVKINEQKNRLIKAGQIVHEFQVNDVPESINLDETLSVSGLGQPSSPVLITIKNQDVLETIQVVNIGVNGEWLFEKSISTDDDLGERTMIIRNNFQSTTKNINFIANQLFSISVFTTTTDSGDIFVLTGTAQPNKDLALSIKNPDDDVIRFDILKIDESGEIKYEFPRDESFKEGTYILRATQNEITQVSLFTLGTTSYDRVVVYLDKMNFKANTESKITVLGPPSTELTLNIFDPSDTRKFTDTIKTNSIGTKTFELDLTGYSSGVYKAVVSNPTYQDTAKFSVGLSSGSGNIIFSSTKPNYSPGESMLIIGNTGANSLLNLLLIDPNGVIIDRFEIFTDKEGGFTTEMLGIPSNAELGIWQIKAQSGLDHKEQVINIVANNDE